MDAVYTHKVLYLEIEDMDAPEGGPDIYVLPGEHDLRLVEGQIAEAQQKIEELAEAIDGCSDVEQAEKLRKEIEVRKALLDGARDRLETSRADLEMFGPEARIYTFQMRRYSWNENQLAREEARIYLPDGVPIIRDREYVLSLLSKCVTAWDVTEPGEANPVTLPINAETIGMRPTPIIDTVFRRLRDKSEVSQERLAFLRADRTRSHRRKPQKSG